MNEYQIKFLKCVKELKIEKLLNSTSTAKNFIYYILKNPIMENQQQITLINASILYIHYCEWCNRNENIVNIVSARKFGIDIKNLLIKKRMSSGIYYKLP